MCYGLDHNVNERPLALLRTHLPSEHQQSMSDDQITWIDQPTWGGRWEVVRRLEGGGQGEAYEARRTIDGRIAFLKTIKAVTDRERRARFFREASAYDTFRVGHVPALIESNAHRHKDSQFEPYIATEFVRGPTLREWREKTVSVTLDEASVIARSLLETLRACHAAGCIHRDVKPDNIILVDGNPNSVALLDFGLSFHETPDVSFQTEHWQEIGNRFLRLPELSAGSFLKQDVRSDLSFAAGILFYAITGQHPDVLQDAEGRLPHQRPQAFSVLQQAGGTRFPRLASLFDNAFSPRIGDRFSDADAMLASLDRMMERHEIRRSPDDDLKAILDIVDTAAERRRVETTRRISEVLRQVQSVYTEIEKSFNGTLGLIQTGHHVAGDSGRNTLIWKRPGSDDRLVSTTYEAIEAGDELIVRMSGETVFRTPISLPSYGDEFRSAVRAWVLSRVRNAISDPNALPPESDLFGEFKPFALLSDASNEARRRGRSILAFVYDPSQKDRGQLHYCLSSFLANRKTRDAINSAFVVALVPMSQVAPVSSVLHGLSMETSRWIIFDQELNPQAQDVIYANAQEGERIVMDLAKRFGTA